VDGKLSKRKTCNDKIPDLLNKGNRPIVFFKTIARTIRLALTSPLASSTRPVKTPHLFKLVQDDMQKVNRLILDRTISDVSLIPELSQHLIDSGGKRLRPMLTLACANLFDYQGEHHIKLAASVEFMHTATLLHDDVVDESDLRRGKQAAHKLWGNQASVLVGDFLLGQAFKMMVEAGNLRALDILSHASAVIAEGEVLQLGTARNLTTTEEDYLAVIRSKTAALFSAACQVGPVLANQNEEMCRALCDYGDNLGIAFQLVDDALDYSGSNSSLGKTVGDDFREGKMTLPVVLAYKNGNDDERAFWARTMQSDATTQADLNQAIHLLQKHQAIEQTIERARHYGQEARQSLTCVPTQAYKEALIEIVDFCIARLN
jgi:octaprenyl-diphosphate synthase